MNSEYPQNRMEAIKAIYKLIKEFWGDTTSIEIYTDVRGMSIKTAENKFYTLGEMNKWEK